MLANPALPRASFRLRPKYLVFTLIGVMTTYVLFHTERFLIEPASPVWDHFRPFKWWLYPHALAGTITMLAAPLQFSDRLRKKYPKVHRVMGRIYVAGVLVLTPLGVYVQYLEQLQGAGTPEFTVLAAVNLVVLVVPTLIALRYAMQRNITLHRQWMTRSFAVALVFFEGRFILGVTGWENDPAMAEPVIWSCLAMAVLIGDLANYFQEPKRARA